MADNDSARGQQDRLRININQEHEVRYWTEHLGISEDELRRAVESVGPMAEDVRRRLLRKVPNRTGTE
jgi:hypothetical protein